MRENHPDYVTMSCRRCGHSLDRIESACCPECGQAFDASDPDTYTRCLDTPTRLPLAATPEEADAIALLLESNGIPAIVEYAAAGFVEPARGSVCVNATDIEPALALLAKLPAEPLTPGDPWTCPKCAERLEGQFSECWNCQTPRPSVG